MAKRRPKRGDLGRLCHVQLVATERRLLRAMESITRRDGPYKGNIFDYPRVKAIMRRRDQLLAGKCGKR